MCYTTDIGGVPGCGRHNFFALLNDILQKRTPQGMHSAEGRPCLVDVSPSQYPWLFVLLDGLHSPSPTAAKAGAIPRSEKPRRHTIHPE